MTGTPLRVLPRSQTWSPLGHGGAVGVGGVDFGGVVGEDDRVEGVGRRSRR
jgi:hypothetical protein